MIFKKLKFLCLCNQGQQQRGGEKLALSVQAMHKTKNLKMTLSKYIENFRLLILFWFWSLLILWNFMYRQGPPSPSGSYFRCAVKHYKNFPSMNTAQQQNSTCRSTLCILQHMHRHTFWGGTQSYQIFSFLNNFKVNISTTLSKW